jgi:hypothetical protein
MRGGASQVNGRLPPEIIQRIVRQNFGRMRQCYEDGLKRDAHLAGRVSVKFIIETNGHVSQVEAIDPPNAGPRIPDPAVVACVADVFGNRRLPRGLQPWRLSDRDRPERQVGASGSVPAVSA